MITRRQLFGVVGAASGLALYTPKRITLQEPRASDLVRVSIKAMGRLCRISAFRTVDDGNEAGDVVLASGEADARWGDGGLYLLEDKVLNAEAQGDLYQFVVHIHMLNRTVHCGPRKFYASVKQGDTITLKLVDRKMVSVL